MKMLFTLSKVMYAVPATDEYAVLIALVDTPGPRSMRRTVKPVYGNPMSYVIVGIEIPTNLGLASRSKEVRKRPIGDPPK